jgi:hypothetical protein
MSKVLVLYYSTYGHLETMAQAVAEGARSAGATVDVKRVPETVPQEIARSAHFKLDQSAPVATVAELGVGSERGSNRGGCNYVRFFSEVRKATFLEACVLSAHFDIVSGHANTLQKFRGSLFHGAVGLVRCAWMR